VRCRACEIRGASQRAPGIRLPAGQNVVPFHTSPTRWAFDLYDVATQTMSSNYVEVVDGRGEYRSIPFRYVWPAELDLMAQLAGAAAARALGWMDTGALHQ
jgi:hypothetical protein